MQAALWGGGWGSRAGDPGRGLSSPSHTPRAVCGVTQCCVSCQVSGIRGQVSGVRGQVSGAAMSDEMVVLQ